MHRRDLLVTAAALSIAATASAEAAEQAQPHHHANYNQALLDSAEHCVKTGKVCEAHCYNRLSEGDKSLAECARSVNALIAVCNALSTLTAQNSALLPAFAAVAKEQCEACETECRKHEQHPPCKACAEACAACAKECAKLAT